uniref:Uncharacterized protein n=1 Tax=Plectus sambesii TaxID=2011161 RepID=A0A914UV59_9BILA
MEKVDVDDDYVQKLESKLSSVKRSGGGREPNAKQIIQDVADLRKFQIASLLDSNSTTQIEPVESEVLSYNYLERKIAPQKVALTKEELALLVDNDSLASKTAAECTVQSKEA